jgi:hypothetical protein
MPENNVPPQKEGDQIEKIQEETSQSLGKFFSPEAVTMFTVAFLVDLGELFWNLIPVIGQAISLGVDFLALLFFGAWIYFRQGFFQAKMSQRGLQNLNKLKKIRPLMIILECLPVVGVVPCWTLLVYFEIKYS